MCARPGRYGNPYRWQDYAIDYPPPYGPADWRRMSVSDFDGMLDGKWGQKHHYPSLEELIAELRGHDLACWCGPDDRCHTDILLVRVNA